MVVARPSVVGYDVPEARFPDLTEDDNAVEAENVEVDNAVEAENVELLRFSGQLWIVTPINNPCSEQRNEFSTNTPEERLKRNIFSETRQDTINHEPHRKKRKSTSYDKDVLNILLENSSRKIQILEYKIEMEKTKLLRLQTELYEKSLKCMEAFSETCSEIKKYFQSLHNMKK